MDKKIKTLEKHFEIAKKEKMIADLENKTKKLEEEWAVHKFGQPGLWSEHTFFIHLREQEDELRAAKQEIKKITDDRDQIIENNNHHHKELRAEKEKFEQESSKLRDLLVEKHKELSKLTGIAAKKEEQLKQKKRRYQSLTTWLPIVHN